MKAQTWCFCMNLFTGFCITATTVLNIFIVFWSKVLYWNYQIWGLWCCNQSETDQFKCFFIYSRFVLPNRLTLYQTGNVRFYQLIHYWLWTPVNHLEGVVGLWWAVTPSIWFQQSSSLCTVSVWGQEGKTSLYSGSYITVRVVKQTPATIRHHNPSWLGSNHSQHCCNTGNQ